jgi:hypothetical protein
MGSNGLSTVLAPVFDLHKNCTTAITQRLLFSKKESYKLFPLLWL